MVMKTKAMTVEQFEEWVNQPESTEHDYEFIAGEIVNVVTHPLSSKIAGKFLIHIGSFVYDKELGHVTGADGGYQVGNERYMPDVGYISFARQAILQSEAGYIPNAPDLAVEVVSPNDTPRQITVKVSNYLAAGTVVWVVYPDDEQVDIHIPSKPVHVVTKDDTLDGGTVLPDFKLKLGDIFK
ncbi:MAG: Uma2 family endonuclease [Anaerolineae bacterium]|nr:Uma2 family endonuclease [Anaerolineae bacterium]